MLAVGDSTRLEIIFNSKTYRSKINKRPRIQTNEGPPDKHVSIIATVTPRPDSTYPIIISPYKIDLSQFSKKLIDKADFTITNVGDKKLDLTMVYMPDGFFDVDLPKSIDPGKSAKGHLKLKKDAIKKDFEKSFTIQLNDEMSTRFTIPVKRTYREAKPQPKTRTLPRGK